MAAATRANEADQMTGVVLNKPWMLLWMLAAAALWLPWWRLSMGRPLDLRKGVITGLRTILIGLVALGLAEPEIQRPTDRVHLMFCQDLSESVGREQDAAVRRFMHRALKGMRDGDRAGLVRFGRRPSLEAEPGTTFAPPADHASLDPTATDIAAAVQLAAGRMPPGGRNRIVLFSDGNETTGRAVDAAHLAAALNVAIYPVALQSWFGGGEAYVAGLETPETVARHTPFAVHIALMSAAAAEGELVVFKNDRLLASQPVALRSGKTVVRLTDTLDAAGLTLYRAVLNVPGDRFFQNNEGLAFTRAVQPSRVLYLSGWDTNRTALAAALQAQGLNLVTGDIRALTGAVHELMAYHAVVLDNLSARHIPFAAMQNVATWVRDLGGGLMVVGGDRSYGAGFYGRTPLERALPVFMDPPTELQFAQLCLILVVDKSSSMIAATAGKSKLEMAKIAAFAAIQMLKPTDRVGILAFARDPEWVVPITAAGRRERIARDLSRLTEGGGTVLYPALQEAFRALQAVPASRRHVIVLSDGQTHSADFKSLLEAMHAQRISVSTVSIGSDADLALMQSIARWGRGRSYHTEHPDRLPEIFTGETRIVARDVIVEKTLNPVRTAASEMLRGIEGDLPVVRGVVATHPKPGAQVIADTAEGPLLAAWRYGLGRSVAFTSDLGPRWGREWAQWRHFGRFAAQMVRWARRPATSRTYRVDVARRGGRGTLTVDVVSDEGRFVNHRDLLANLLLPDGQKHVLVLEQTAPGCYVGEFPARQVGGYVFSLFDSGPERTSEPHLFGLGVPFSDEFARPTPDHALLDRLAAISGGRVMPLDAEDAPELFTVQGDGATRTTALWPHLVMVFLALLTAEAAARKLLA